MINLFTLIRNALKTAKKRQISGVMGFYYIRYYLKHYTGRILAQNDYIFNFLCTFASKLIPNRGTIWKLTIKRHGKSRIGHRRGQRK